MTYSEYINSDTWKRLRARRIAYDGGRCLLCGQDAPPLDVHHLRYPDEWGKEDLEHDLVTLCRACHERLHRVKRDYTPRVLDLLDGYREAHRRQNERITERYYTVGSEILADAVEEWIGDRRGSRLWAWQHIVAATLELPLHVSQIPLPRPATGERMPLTQRVARLLKRKRGKR